MTLILEPMRAMEIAADKRHLSNVLFANLGEFYLENRHASPTAEQYAEAAETVQDAIGLNLTAEQIESILSLYPRARITLAHYGIDDTDANHQLADAIAHFFMSCDWPTNGDDVDIAKFHDLLRERAHAFGFTDA